MTGVLTPLQIPGGFGGLELAVILMIAILLFGANKIPKLARSTGQAMGEFRRGREEIEDELEELQGSGTSESGTSTTDSEVEQSTTPDSSEKEE